MAPTSVNHTQLQRKITKVGVNKYSFNLNVHTRAAIMQKDFDPPGRWKRVFKIAIMPVGFYGISHLIRFVSNFSFSRAKTQSLFL